MEQAANEDGADEGDFVFPDNSEYRGQYVRKGEKAILQGQGRLQTGSDVFEGIFANGLYKVGKYTSCGGTVYNGSFRNNQFHGPGDCIWPDGRKYSGMWKEGVMHGRGKFENFCIGADRIIEGFAFEGSFLTSREDQAQVKRAFLADYGQAYIQSATEVLTKLVEGLQGEVDAKGKTAGKAELSAEALKEFLVPEDKDPEAALELTAVQAVVAGPFPETVKPAAFQALAETFLEGAEKPGEVRLLEDAAACGKMDGKRFKCAQLGHVGQGVLFLAPVGTEAGSALSELLLVNIADEYDVAAARWKIVHCEEAAPPAAGE